MADINAYLREAINGPAPQHKVAGRNQFEISEGSDGATHTKIVDVDGNPLSSVPVEDEAVKAELAEIKATQAEILDRLDGTFDTRLTGSIVGLNSKNLPDTIVTAGSYYSLLDVDTYLYKKIRGSIRWEEKPSNHFIRAYARPQHHAFGYYMDIPLDGQRDSFEIDTFASVMEVRLYNGSDDDHALQNFEVIGVL